MRNLEHILDAVVWRCCHCKIMVIFKRHVAPVNHHRLIKIFYKHTDRLNSDRLGETGVKSNKKCISDSVAEGKQPMQLFRGSFCTSILGFSGQVNVFGWNGVYRLIFLKENVTSAVTIDLRHGVNCNRARCQMYHVYAYGEVTTTC